MSDMLTAVMITLTTPIPKVATALQRQSALSKHKIPRLNGNPKTYVADQLTLDTLLSLTLKRFSRTFLQNLR